MHLSNRMSPLRKCQLEIFDDVECLNEFYFELSQSNLFSMILIHIYQ